MAKPAFDHQYNDELIRNNLCMPGLIADWRIYNVAHLVRILAVTHISFRQPAAIAHDHQTARHIPGRTLINALIKIRAIPSGNRKPTVCHVIEEPARRKTFQLIP